MECDDEADDTVEDPDYVQPDLHKDSCSSTRTRSQLEQIASRDAIVTEVDQNPISWVVPSFPVMTLQFVKVKYVDGDSVLTGLINYSDCLQHDELPTTISWKSSCQIQLQDGNEYKVFWKWTKTLNELHENWEEISTSESEVSHISETTSSSSEKSVKSVTEYSTEENGSSDDVESDSTPIYHTLPFKVIGVAHSTKTQDRLDEALTKMKGGETVSAMLKPEPENEFDREAIAVHLDYGNGPCFIGYIPRELTKYLHPLLETRQITQVKVEDIRFRTSFSKFGLYIKISITRIGRWEPFVVRASLSVR